VSAAPISVGAAVQAAAAWGEMIKISHSVFALPFAVLATFLAARPGLPSLTQGVLIVLCMVAARSAAMTFNRLIDAKFDARNPRTATRHIPAGRISPRAAWSFFAVACSAFVLACGGFWGLAGNAWPLLLSVPTLAILCGYSYTKRFTRWSHVVLGASIALAPVAAWIAISPQTLGGPAWLLMLAVALWIAGFDVIYACQDVAFDRAAGLHSLPAALGPAAALWLARFFHVGTVAALAGVGGAANLGWLYYAGVGCVVLLLVVEHSLVRADDLSRVNLAFFTMNGIVGLVLGTLGVLDICLRT
jgi:4-hydroxybenzoate polyprenyltransferase